MVDFDSLVNGPVASVFGEQWLYQPVSGSAYGITGIFAEPYRRQEFRDDGEAHWITVAPSVGIQLSQLKSGVAANDRLTRLKTGVVYRINEPQPNGVGWINLTLMESK